MSPQRIFMLVCRRRTLIMLSAMTTLFMMLLNRKASHQDPLIPAVPVQRRDVILEDLNLKDDLTYQLKFQEQKLLKKAMDVASDTIRDELMLSNDLNPGKEAAVLHRKTMKPTMRPHKPLEIEAKKPVESAAQNPKVVEQKPVEIANKKSVEIVDQKSAEVEPPKPKEVPPQKSTTKYPPHLHPDRYKFIYKKEKLSKDGPKLNLIPETTTWRHELAHDGICNSTDPFILAIIPSSVPGQELREYIRRTWANPRLYPYTKIRSLFILGSTPDTSIQEKVDAENAKYKDIIQYNHLDSYNNLPIKTLAWLIWVGKNCPQAPFIAKIDADVMVNPFHLRKFFEEKLKKPPLPQTKLAAKEAEGKTLTETGDNIATDYIYGRYDGDPYPMRYSKWGVTMEEYPEKNYPPFVHGPAYVVGRSAAKRLLEYTPYVSLIKLEDVYTTGLVAHAAQVKHVNIFGTVNTFKANIELYNGTQALMEETGPKKREEAWEGISLHAPIDIKALGTPWT